MPAEIPYVLHVEPIDSRSWRVREEGADGPDATYSTREEAIDEAARLARAQEYAHVIVHSPDGGVEREWTHGVAPSRHSSR